MARPGRSRCFLGLDVHFGLPEDISQRRLAHIERIWPLAALLEARHLPARRCL